VSDAGRNLPQGVDPVAALGSVSGPRRGNQHGVDDNKCKSTTHPSLLGTGLLVSFHKSVATIESLTGTPLTLTREGSR
jgi:hypothetical protein